EISALSYVHDKISITWARNGFHCLFYGIFFLDILREQKNSFFILSEYHFYPIEISIVTIVFFEWFFVFCRKDEYNEKKKCSKKSKSSFCDLIHVNKPSCIRFIYWI